MTANQAASSCSAVFALLTLTQEARAGTWQFTTIKVPGVQIVSAVGINDSNQVVGYYQDAKTHYHGYVWADGKLTKVDANGYKETRLQGVNDSGIVTGVAWSRGYDRATCVPYVAPG